MIQPHRLKHFSKPLLPVSTTPPPFPLLRLRNFDNFVTLSKQQASQQQLLLQSHFAPFFHPFNFYFPGHGPTAQHPPSQRPHPPHSTCARTSGFRFNAAPGHTPAWKRLRPDPLKGQLGTTLHPVAHSGGVRYLMGGLSELRLKNAGGASSPFSLAPTKTRDTTPLSPRFLFPWWFSCYFPKPPPSAVPLSRRRVLQSRATFVQQTHLNGPLRLTVPSPCPRGLSIWIVSAQQGVPGTVQGTDKDTRAGL